MGGRGTFAHLFGREADLDALRGLVAVPGVVTLSGPGGVGKTRIADHLVAELAADGADVVVVPLDEVADASLVGHTVAAALGIRSAGDPGDPSYVASRLGERRVTLVLDNCEHLVAALAPLVVAISRTCPHARVICTSQVPLGISAETVYRVGPLELPAEDGPQDADRPAAAVAMFANRARSALPGFVLTPANAAVVGAVVRSLDGLPLAIELAAARLGVLSLEDLSERLEDRFRLLDRGYRDAPERHRSLQASIAWVDDLCTAGERRLWARLSVFVGGFTLGDVEQVCSGDGIDVADVLDLLAGLVDKSVVERSDSGIDHYRMLDSVRAFGAVRLAAEGSTVWQDRHLRWFAATTDDLRAQWLGPDQVSWVQRLELHGGNLRAAMEHALAAAGTVPLALRMCLCLKPFWVATGRLAEGRYWVDRALAPGVGSAEDRAFAAQTGGLMATLQGDAPHARTMVDLARAADLDPDDAYLQGALAHVEGQVLLWEGDREGGMHQLREAVRLLRLVPPRYEFLGTLVVVGANLTELGAPEEGLALLREAADFGERTGERSIRGHAQAWLALHPAVSVDRDATRSLLSSSLGMSWELRDVGAITTQIEGMAQLAFADGEHPRCAALLGAAAAAWQRMNLGVERMPVMASASYERFAWRFEVPEKHPESYARGLALGLEEAVRLALDPKDDGSGSTTPPATDDALGPLTRRETEIAHLVAEGLSNRDIATRLFISERTAQGHVQNTLRKLDFGSRAQIATWVVRQRG